MTDKHQKKLKDAVQADRNKRLRELSQTGHDDTLGRKIMRLARGRRGRPRGTDGGTYT